MEYRVSITQQRAAGACTRPLRPGCDCASGLRSRAVTSRNHAAWLRDMTVRRAWAVMATRGANAAQARAARRRCSRSRMTAVLTCL